jgi:hypothetical protein
MIKLALNSCMKQNEATGTFRMMGIAVLLLMIKQIYGLQETDHDSSLSRNR